MKQLYILLALLASLLGARREGPDDQYVRIYNLIQQADSLQANGQPSQALTKYLEAQSGLQRFRKGYPEWNVKVVNFRLNYLAAKVAALSGSTPSPTPTPTVAPPAPATPLKPAESVTVPATRLPGNAASLPSDLQNQLYLLKDQARQLQAEKQVLEAKLKEALAAQPATVDSREFANAQQKVDTL